MNQKQIIKKIIKEELTPEEESVLLDRPSIFNRMQTEWVNASKHSLIDMPDLNKIWTEIQKKAWGETVQRRLIYYKIYSITASVLLVVALGLTAWIYKANQELPNLMYVVSSGRQSMNSIILPDGTNVLISAGSKLIYPTKFKGETRKVHLSGQAFFEVAKNKEKPFIVVTEQMEVTALGTAFEVFSYDSEKAAETVLLNGKVKVKPRISKSVGYILNPNEKLSITESGSVKIEAVDANKYSAWRSKGHLSFENEKLSMIIPRMEKWYGRKIFCDKNIAENHRFSFTVDDESLELLLQMLEKISPLNYHEKGRDFIISIKPENE